jgi:hypothetical protein
MWSGVDLPEVAGVTPEDQLLVQFQGMIAEYERALELAIRLILASTAELGSNGGM